MSLLSGADIIAGDIITEPIKILDDLFGDGE